MAKTKAELLIDAKKLGLDIDSSATIAVIKEQLSSAMSTTSETIEDPITETSEVATAKAGKRSAKALKQVEETIKKEERKKSGEPDENSSKLKTDKK
jgi:hypothetical protein